MISETNYDVEEVRSAAIYTNSGDIDLNPGRVSGSPKAACLSFGRSAWTDACTLGFYCYLNP